MTEKVLRLVFLQGPWERFVCQYVLKLSVLLQVSYFLRLYLDKGIFHSSCKRPVSLRTHIGPLIPLRGFMDSCSMNCHPGSVLTPQPPALHAL